MANFKIVVCTNPGCDLRFPLDLDRYQAKFCPRCGAPLRVTRDIQPYQGLAQDSQKPRRILTVLLDNIRSAYNVGAIFRTSDGIGVQKLYLCGITPTPDGTPSVEKTSLGAQNDISWEYHPNALTTAQELKEGGHHLIALERTANAVSIVDYHPPANEDGPLVLILGNEQAGVDPALVNLCEAVLSLPMAGKKASLNVSVAFGAAAYWLSFG